MTDFFDTKVDEFKKLFASSMDVVEGGQFAVTNALINQRAYDIDKELKATPGAPAAVGAALKDYVKNDTANDYRVRANAALKAIKDATLEGSFPITTKMLSPDPEATVQWAAQKYGAVWTSPGMTNVPVGILVTADKIKVMYDYEKDKCYRTAQAMGAKTVLARASGLKSNPANYSGGQIAGAKVTSAGTRDLIKYTSLDQAVGAIVKAMSGGYAYVFGVLSGVQGGPSPDPKNNVPGDPEHYILAFAQGTLNGKQAFLFWDPDAGVTNLRSRTWGYGFGLIYNSDGHLSTAEDQTDFDKVDAGGDHLNNTARHCYQVFLAAPSP